MGGRGRGGLGDGAESSLDGEGGVGGAELGGGGRTFLWFAGCGRGVEEGEVWVGGDWGEGNLDGGEGGVSLPPQTNREP